MGRLLDQLPREIIVEIISYISSPRDASALSCQCSRFHTLCEMGTRRRHCRIRVGADEDLDRAFARLLEILRTPRLGQYVRHLEIYRGSHLDIWKPYQENPFERVLAEDDLVRLRAAVERAGFEGRQGEQVVNMLMQQDPAPRYVPG
jgi:hypothetical protein